MAIPLSELKGILFDAYKRSNKTHFEIAWEIGSRSTQTSINAITENNQPASDTVITKVMEVLKIDGFILTYHGTKYYYVKER